MRKPAILAALLLSTTLLMAADDRIPFTDAEKQELSALIGKAQAYDRALGSLIKDFIEADPTAKQIKQDFDTANGAVSAYLDGRHEAHGLKKDEYQIDLKDTATAGFVKIQK